MFWLIHNCVVHPICGIIWFAGDVTHNHKFAKFADRLHAWTPKRKAHP